MPDTAKYNHLGQIFNLIRSQAPITRARLSEITGINLMSVGKNVDTLLERKLIVQKRQSSAGIGRRAGILEINSAMSFAVIDLTSYNFALYIYDINFKQAEKMLHKYDPVKDFNSNLRKFLSDCANFIEHTGESRLIISIGVSVPGPYDSSSDTIINKRMPELNEIMIVRIIEFTVGRKVSYIDENVKQSIYAHMHTIPDYDKKSMVYLHIGDGIGGALTYNGEILRGHEKFAGDMGQLIFTSDGKTLEQILKYSTDTSEIQAALNKFVYNAMWFFDPDTIIIEYNRESNPLITKEMFSQLNTEAMFLPLKRKMPEFIITDSIKKAHLGIGILVRDNLLNISCDD